MFQKTKTRFDRLEKNPKIALEKDWRLTGQGRKRENQLQKFHCESISSHSPCLFEGSKERESLRLLDH